MNAAKFWSDDFDMDLLKLFPDLPRMIGADMRERTFWTVGHQTYGRLNHPAVWNTHGAYVWADKPNLVRDKHGWYSINGCVANEPEIECTFLELLRDQWPHSYDFILLPHGQLFKGPDRWTFDRIMYHIRGWRNDPEHNTTKLLAMAWAVQLSRDVEGLLLEVEQERA